LNRDQPKMNRVQPKNEPSSAGISAQFRLAIRCLLQFQIEEVNCNGPIPSF
jgi:hypothetical protein